MSNSIVNFIIDTYLSSLIEIDTKSVKASLFKGTVSLSNLKLKPSFFDNMNLPNINILNGYIGALDIKVSVPLFYKNPIKVTISKVFFNVQQRNLNNLSEKDEIARMEKRKMNNLNNIEGIGIYLEKYMKEATESKMTMCQNIISNLDIEINDVFFRFEDSVTSSKTAHVMGIVIKNIRISPTENNTNQNYIGKEIKVSNMNMFLDSLSDQFDIIINSERCNVQVDQALLKSLGDQKDFYIFCMDEILNKYSIPTSHQYLLYNFKFNSKVVVNKDINTKTEKRFDIQLTIANIELYSSIKQIEIINAFINYVKIKKMYQERIYNNFYTRKYDKNALLVYMDSYMKYYKTKYIDGKIEGNVFSFENRDSFESGKEYEDIITVRKAALLKMEYSMKLSDINSQITKLEAKWFGAKSKEIDDLNKKKQALLKTETDVKDQIDKLLSQLDKDRNEETDTTNVIIEEQQNTFKKVKEAQAIKDIISINIVSLKMAIDDDYSNKILSLELSTFIFSFENRFNGYKLSILLSTISLLQFISNNQYFPEILYTKKTNDNENLLEMSYEHNPNIETSDNLLIINSTALLYIVSDYFVMSTLIGKFKKIFKAINYKAIRSNYKEKVLQNIKEGYIEKMLTSINNFTIDIRLNLKLPSIVFPLDVAQIKTRKCLLLDGGLFTLTTRLPKKNKQQEQNVKPKLDDDDIYYDQYTIAVKGVTLSTCDNYMLKADSCALKKIINDTFLNMEIKVIPDGPSVLDKRLEIESIVNSLDIKISDEQIERIMNYGGIAVKEAKRLIKTKVLFENNIIPNEEIDNDVNMISTSVLSKKDEVKENEEDSIILLIIEKLKEYKSSLNKTLTLQSSKTLKKESIKLDAKLNSSGMSITLYKKMTTDELRIFNSDLPSLDKSISPMSTPMEEKPFIAIKASDINTHITISDKLNVKVVQSLNSLSIKDVEQYINRKNELDFYVHPNHQNILQCEASKGYKNTIEPFGTMKFKFKPEENKTSLSIMLLPILIKPNVTSSSRIVVFLNYYITLYAKLLKEDSNLDEDCKKITSLKKSRMSASKGINPNYFSLLLKDISKYPDKKSLLDSIKNISSELATTFSTKKTGTSSKKSKTVTENIKSMVKFGIEVKRVLIHLPIDETKEKCPLIEISTNVTSKYKSSYDIDVEFNSKKTKAIYYTYTKLTAMTNTMITKVNLSIIDSDAQKYTLLDNFRMTLRSSAYLALDSQNVITNIELIVEPIVIEANVMHFSLIDKINQKIKKYNDDILSDYTIAKVESPMSFGVNLKLFSKIQKEISNKVKTVSKKVIFESMFNISKFNWHYHFDFSMDKFTLHLYKPSTKPTEKLPLFTISVYQASLSVITNNDPVDAMNFANALVEIISGKEIPIEQFNIYAMYRYALLKTNLRVNYYNPLVSTEEPLIEPYSFLVRLTKVSKVTRLKFELLSDDMLNINVSEKVLLMISKLMKAVKSEKAEDDNDYNSALVKIRNFTGVDISVVFDVNPEDKIEIKNGEIRDFTYKEILKRQAKKNIVSHIGDDKISINIMGHTSIKSFDYNGNTSNIYRISTNNEEVKNHTVDVNVTATMLNSVKVITISSCIKVNNQTELDMYLTVRDDKKSETKRILPKEMFYVPLGWIDLKKKIYIKKEENDPDIQLYNTFCSVLYEEEEVEIGSSTIATLKDSDSGSSELETFERVIQLKESIYITVDVYVFETIKNDTNSNNTLNPIDIVINPPVIIENQIPTQFPFKVTDYSINPNGKYLNLLEKVPIHNVYPDDNRTLMTITLSYYSDVFNSQLFNIYELKDYITLVNVDEDQFKCSIKLVDMYSVYKYDSMICNIVPEKSTSIARMYIFYFEYVISNCLLYPLVMIPTETTLKSTIQLNRKAVTLISSKSKVMQVQNNEYLSHPFRMDTYGLSGMIKWKHLQRPVSISNPYKVNAWRPPDVAITISTSPLYPNSTLVMFESRYLFINKTPLYLKIKGEYDKSSVGVDVNGLKEIHASVGNEFYQIIIADKVGATSVERKFISDYFNITKVNEFDVKIQIEKNEAFTLYKDKPYVFSYDDISYYLIFRISITTQDNASLFITATLPDTPLLRMVNETDTKIEIAVSQSELINLLPGKNVPFAWKNNEVQSTVLYCRMFTSEMTFSFSKFDKNEFTVTNSKGEIKKVHLSVSSESKGVTRVFSVKYKDDEIEKLSAFHQFYLKKKVPKATKFNCSLFGIGISMIDNKPQEIFYASFYGIDLKISSSILKSEHIVKDIKKYLLFIKNIQLDYCLNDSFRNVFHPKLQILPSNESQVMNNKDILCLPFVQIYICHQITHNLITEEKVEKYPQVDTIIQEFCVNIEQTALNKIFDIYHNAEMFIHDITDMKKDDKALMIVDDVKVAPFSELVDSEKTKKRMVLINYLFLSAIKIELTIKLDIDDLNLKYVPPLIHKIVLSLGDSLSSITKSPIKLGEMIYQNVFINTKKLISLIGAHYMNQGLTQVYKIMGTTDLLTNPVRLVDNIGTGFVELFNEPRKGFLQGPNKYGSGLQKGVKSLLQKVGGSDSVVNATGTLMSTTKKGKGKKKKQDVKEEMSGVTETAAVHKGAEEINKGFQGVIENPYKNAKINGVQGFIKGLGSGFLETILTPLSSMLTFSKNNSTWMKNTAIKFAGGKIKTCRFRHPRVIYQNEPLTEYDANLAEVNEILHRMKKTSFNKIFLFADIKKEGDEDKYLTLILTDRFFLLTYNMIEEPLMIRVRDVASCEVHIEGDMYSVTFIMNTGRRKGFKLYEQKVACRLYDLFKKITSGNIPIDKSNTIYENEF